MCENRNIAYLLVAFSIWFDTLRVQKWANRPKRRRERRGLLRQRDECEPEDAKGVMLVSALLSSVDGTVCDYWQKSLSFSSDGLSI